MCVRYAFNCAPLLHTFRHINTSVIGRCFVLEEWYRGFMWPMLMVSASIKIIVVVKVIMIY